MFQFLVILSFVSVVIFLVNILDRKGPFQNYALFLFFLFLGMAYIQKNWYQVKSDPIDIYYKVKDLESNTVFTVKDSLDVFSTNDSVYVNMNTLLIDPKDPAAMKCIVINAHKVWRN